MHAIHTRTIALVAASLIAMGLGKLATAEGAEPAAAAPTPTATPVLVTIENFAFSPATVDIPVGGSVTWKNLDTASHTATDTNGAFDSKNLDQGMSFTFTFTKAGTYDYVCSYHPYMKGTIVVGAPSSSASSPP
jgi:plastocyanin